MRLWQGIALTTVAIALVLTLCKVHEVSAQKKEQSMALAAGQPMPGFQPPFPSGPAMQLPGQPPAAGAPVFPKPPAPMPPVAIAANSDFVYLVWGNMLLQFDARNLKLLKRIPLKGEFPVEKPKREKEKPKELRDKPEKAKPTESTQPQKEQPKVEK